MYYIVYLVNSVFVWSLWAHKIYFKRMWVFFCESKPKKRLINYMYLGRFVFSVGMICTSLSQPPPP